MFTETSVINKIFVETQLTL